jgi:hypothetical protein
MGSDNGPQQQWQPNCLQQTCGCRYRPSVEKLEYDYSKDETSKAGKHQPLPRIRQRGEYYIDSFNAESWACTFGTQEEVSWSFVAAFI